MNFSPSWTRPDSCKEPQDNPDSFPMLRIFLTIIQVFSAFAIVGLVLLQRGKGAEAGAGFGAGASGTVFGARGASTALSRATAIFAAVFMANSLALAYMGTRASEAPQSILDKATESAPKTPAPGAARTLPPAATTPAAPASVPVPAPNTSAAPASTPTSGTTTPSPGVTAPPPSPAPSPK
jgi:preprotein translocase subunit SecG